MRFLIRDDDTCAYTRPEELEKCYAGIWDRVPVGLAVTPFRIPGDNHTVPDRVRRGTEPLPLADSPELVSFLKELLAAGRAEILLHGYEHTMPGGLPEYVGGQDLLAKTREGKAYLEDLLGCRIDTFVPPNNGIGREGLEAVVACGLNLVNVPPLLRTSRRRLHVGNLSKYLKVKFYNRVLGMKYPYVLTFPDHKELEYISMTPSQDLEGLMDAFAKCRRQQGVFVAAIHYHAFDRRLQSGESIRQALEILLDISENIPGVEYPGFAKTWRTG